MTSNFNRQQLNPPNSPKFESLLNFGSGQPILGSLLGTDTSAQGDGSQSTDYTEFTEANTTFLATDLTTSASEYTDASPYRRSFKQQHNRGNAPNNADSAPATSNQPQTTYDDRLQNHGKQIYPPQPSTTDQQDDLTDGLAGNEVKRVRLSMPHKFDESFNYQTVTPALLKEPWDQVKSRPTGHQVVGADEGQHILVNLTDHKHFPPDQPLPWVSQDRLYQSGANSWVTGGFNSGILDPSNFNSTSSTRSHNQFDTSLNNLSTMTNGFTENRPASPTPTTQSHFFKNRSFDDTFAPNDHMDDIDDGTQHGSRAPTHLAALVSPNVKNPPKNASKHNSQPITHQPQPQPQPRSQDDHSLSTIAPPNERTNGTDLLEHHNRLWDTAPSLASPPKNIRDHTQEHRLYERNGPLEHNSHNNQYHIAPNTSKPHTTSSDHHDVREQHDQRDLHAQRALETDQRSQYQNPTRNYSSTQFSLTTTTTTIATAADQSERNHRLERNDRNENNNIHSTSPPSTALASSAKRKSVTFPADSQLQDQRNIPHRDDYQFAFTQSQSQSQSEPQSDQSFDDRSIDHDDYEADQTHLFNISAIHPNPRNRDSVFSTTAETVVSDPTFSTTADTIVFDSNSNGNEGRIEHRVEPRKNEPRNTVPISTTPPKQPQPPPSRTPKTPHKTPFKTPAKLPGEEGDSSPPIAPIGAMDDSNDVHGTMDQNNAHDFSQYFANTQNGTEVKDSTRSLSSADLQPPPSSASTSTRPTSLKTPSTTSLPAVNAATQTPPTTTTTSAVKEEIIDDSTQHLSSNSNSKSMSDKSQPSANRLPPFTPTSSTLAPTTPIPPKPSQPIKQPTSVTPRSKQKRIITSDAESDNEEGEIKQDTASPVQRHSQHQNQHNQQQRESTVSSNVIKRQVTPDKSNTNLPQDTPSRPLLPTQHRTRNEIKQSNTPSVAMKRKSAKKNNNNDSQDDDYGLDFGDHFQTEAGDVGDDDYVNNMDDGYVPDQDPDNGDDDDDDDDHTNSNSNQSFVTEYDENGYINADLDAEIPPHLDNDSEGEIAAVSNNKGRKERQRRRDTIMRIGAEHEGLRRSSRRRIKGVIRHWMGEYMHYSRSGEDPLDEVLPHPTGIGNAVEEQFTEAELEARNQAERERKLKRQEAARKAQASRNQGGTFTAGSTKITPTIVKHVLYGFSDSKFFPHVGAEMDESKYDDHNFTVYNDDFTKVLKKKGELEIDFDDETMVEMPCVLPSVTQELFPLDHISKSNRKKADSALRNDDEDDEPIQSFIAHSDKDFGTGTMIIPPEVSKITEKAAAFHCFFVVYCEMGKLSARVDGRVHHLAQGDWLKVPNGVSYTLSNLSKTVDARLVFVIRQYEDENQVEPPSPPAKAKSSAHVAKDNKQDTTSKSSNTSSSSSSKSRKVSLNLSDDDDDDDQSDEDAFDALAKRSEPSKKSKPVSKAMTNLSDSEYTESDDELILQPRSSSKKSSSNRASTKLTKSKKSSSKSTHGDESDPEPEENDKADNKEKPSSKSKSSSSKDKKNSMTSKKNESTPTRSSTRSKPTPRYNYSLDDDKEYQDFLKSEQAKKDKRKSTTTSSSSKPAKDKKDKSEKKDKKRKKQLELDDNLGDDFSDFTNIPSSPSQFASRKINLKKPVGSVGTLRIDEDDDDMYEYSSSSATRAQKKAFAQLAPMIDDDDDIAFR